MKLNTYYTIQHKDAWQLALQTGSLTGHPDYIEKSFIQPYAWLLTQMRKRSLVPNDSTTYPVWAWDQLPDLLQPHHLPANTPGILIAFEANPANALITLFDEWHILLNADDEAYKHSQSNIPGLGTFLWEDIIVSVDQIEAYRASKLQYAFKNITLDQVVETTPFIAPLHA